jgi:hypothetical protein
MITAKTNKFKIKELFHFIECGSREYIFTGKGVLLKDTVLLMLAQNKVVTKVITKIERALRILMQTRKYNDTTEVQLNYTSRLQKNKSQLFLLHLFIILLLQIA